MIYRNNKGPVYDKKVAKHRTAERICKFLNSLSILCAAGLVFFPSSYPLAVAVNIAIPLICIAVLKLYSKYVRIDAERHLVKPTIYYAMLYVSLSLTLTSFKLFNILEYFLLWLLVFGFTLLILCFLFFNNIEYKFQPFKVYLKTATSYVFLIGYAYGTITSLNAVLDDSTPQVYYSTILKKHLGGRRGSPSFLLGPWGPKKNKNTIYVSSKFFRDHQVKDHVVILIFNGKFGIPWYTINEL
ncbi:hypothetical protein [Sphingobacterium gobiense]|uniref:Uncharacterized protein n=1 Tax=Sphingobacterium gobiense TaxID=1382456 RepID=A0A2S9JRY3_9SPHI|nr:hypothetical protein [Sphingobacterium gobiense]PRD56013.1 hypothetical protein C5749_01610 [Sphingobacterium gobiense]